MSRRLILGRMPAGTPGSGYGLRIAQAGYDAATAADANLLFSSDWPLTLPILAKSSIRIPATGNAASGASNIVSVPFTSFGTIPHIACLLYPLTSGSFMGSSYTPLNAVLNNSDRSGKSGVMVRTYVDHFTANFFWFSNTGLQEPNWPTAIVLYYTIFRVGIS